MLGQNHHFNHYAPTCPLRDRTLPAGNQTPVWRTGNRVAMAPLPGRRTTTALPILRLIPGLCLIRASASIWRIIRRCATGLNASVTARQRNVPINWQIKPNAAPGYIVYTSERGNRCDLPCVALFKRLATLSFLHFPCIPEYKQSDLRRISDAMPATRCHYPY